MSPTLSKFKSSIATFFVLSFFSVFVFAQSAQRNDATPPPVILDGNFIEWTHATLVLDADGDLAAGSRRASASLQSAIQSNGEIGLPLTLQKLMLRDDPAWLYASIEFDKEVNLQSMLGTMHILIDADGDSKTGETVVGMSGVDFALDLSRMDMPQPSGYGNGFALRTISKQGLQDYRSAYDQEVMAAPTYANKRFELRISRVGAQDGFGRLGNAVRLKFVFSQNDKTLDLTNIGIYKLLSPVGTDPYQSSIEALHRVPDSLRVLAWNVNRDNFRDPANHAQLIASVKPDIIMLDEMHGDVTVQELKRFFALPWLKELGEWKFVLGESGGVQKTLVAARNYTIRPVTSMRRVDYVASAIEALKSETPKLLHSWLDTELAAGLSTTAAWVTVAEQDMLFVPVDFQSGGAARGPKDSLRKLQARTIKEQLKIVLQQNQQNAPIVIAGDFNLVGSSTPIEIVSQGLDVDNSDLEIADLYRLGERTQTTWRNPPDGLFGPGRLDFLVYPDAVFEQVGGFVFTSEDLTSKQLSQLALTRNQSRLASDHMIIVTDFRLR